MNITIVGGGNIGTQFAVHCAQQNHNVVVFSSKPTLFSKRICCVDAQNNVTCSGEICCATADPALAFQSADVIFVTVPADCMEQYAAVIYPHIKPGVKIGLIPGTGGGECAFSRCREKGAVIFGLQRVPAVSRLVEYGKTVRSTGYREQLYAAALPQNEAPACCQLLEDIFHIPCAALPNYLNLTLTPSNPILHTTRLRTLYKDYIPGKVYKQIPLFYQHWDNESSQLLIACDQEVQALCQAMREFDLSGVKSLKEHYESDTPEKMTYKISHIPAFQGLPSPQIATADGFIPDLNSRYFIADFSYGLAILVQVANMVGLSVVNMEQTLQWYQTLAGNPKMFRFSDWGIHNYQDLLRFYMQ